MIKIGVLSDTHGHLDPRIAEIFQGVDHILHGGDIGLPWLLLELEYLAPVTAVLGNTDSGLTQFKETEVITLGARKFLLHHMVDPAQPHEALQRRLVRENPDVVVFGHTHRHYCQTLGQTLFFNPGYAGKPKENQLRSVAVLYCDELEIRAEFHEL